MKRSPVLLMLCKGLLCCAAVTPAFGQLVVSTTEDENDTPPGSAVSLREAVRDTPGGGTVTFDPALNGKVFFLLAGELAVSGRSLTVDASALADGVIIDAVRRSRHFNVVADATLRLTKVHLQGGAAGSGLNGGGILSAGTLMLTDCVIRDNSAGDGNNGTQGRNGVAPANFQSPDYFYAERGGNGGAGGSGGAISSTGSLTATRCRFVSNKGGDGGAGGGGGGTWGGADGGNGAGGGSGGAVHSSGSLILTDCRFDSNTSGAGGMGGYGAYNDLVSTSGGSGGSAGNGGAVAHTGTLTAQRCTFTGNKTLAAGPRRQPENGWTFTQSGAGGNGGGLFCAGATANLTNCTFSANETQEGGIAVGGGNGGAVASGTDSLLTMIHCTLVSNRTTRVSWLDPFFKTAAGKGAGIYTGGGTATIQNCLIAANRTPTSENNIYTTITATITPPSVFTDNPVVDPRLAELTEGAGGTAVRTLLAGSPALDGGMVLAGGPATDQRGLPRAVNAPDLGAVEMQATEPPALKTQSISFTPAAVTEFSAARTVNLSATASSSLPVVYSLVSGPATLDGSVLTVNGTGFVCVRASQAGTSEFAAALPVTRTISVTGLSQSFTMPTLGWYYYYGESYTLPATTGSGQPVTWSVEGSASLAGNVLTLTLSPYVPTPPRVILTASAPGNAVYAPLFASRTYDMTLPRIKIESVNGQSTLKEGEAETATVRVSIPSARATNVPFTLYKPDAQVVVQGSTVIPAGQSSVDLTISALDDNIAENSETVYVYPSAPDYLNFQFSSQLRITVMDNDSYIQVARPRAFTAGYPAWIELSLRAPDGTVLPAPDGISFTVGAYRGGGSDNPFAVTPASAGPFSAGQRMRIPVTFPATAESVRFDITASNGLTLHSAEDYFAVGSQKDVDRDGIDDLIEGVLQTDNTVNTPSPPPLTVQRDGAGRLHVIFAKRPVNLMGWTARVMISDNLIDWTPAAPGTVTSNADGFTQQVDIPLPATGGQWFSRLEIAPAP